MDRYDWEWGRRYGGPGRWSYDRDQGFQGEWPGRSYRRGPRGGYRFDRGFTSGYGGYDEYGGYDQPGYRFSYGRPGGWGWRGRMESWEPGPPGGYGAEWGTAYGERRRGRYDSPGWRGGYGREFGRFEPLYGRGSDGLGEFPGGYYDDFDPELEAEASEADIAAMQRQWDDVPDDDEVRDAVARSLRDDGFIDADAIQVEVKDRVVTLRGEVKDYMEARYAWDDAWDAPGVRGVISKLTVGKAEE